MYDSRLDEDRTHPPVSRDLPPPLHVAEPGTFASDETMQSLPVMRSTSPRPPHGNRDEAVKSEPRGQNCTNNQLSRSVLQSYCIVCYSYTAEEVAHERNEPAWKTWGRGAGGRELLLNRLLISWRVQYRDYCCRTYGWKHYSLYRRNQQPGAFRCLPPCLFV